MLILFRCCLEKLNLLQQTNPTSNLAWLPPPKQNEPFGFGAAKTAPSFYLATSSVGTSASPTSHHNSLRILPSTKYSHILL